MKIMDRYLILHFLRPMLACGAVFSILVFVGHFFDKMDIFNRYHAHSGDIFIYVLLGLPYWLNVIFPVVTLLALMFSLGPLLQRGEITALRSAGVPSIRIYVPFLAMGTLISLVSLIGGMTLLPAISGTANRIYREKIKHEPAFNTMKDHIVVTGRNHRLFTIGLLDTQAGKMTDVVIDQFDDQMRRLSTLSAQEGQYQNGVWTFRRGNLTRYDSNGNYQHEPFQEKVIDIDEKPEDFLYDTRKPDDLTHKELRARIRHLRELGVPSFKEQVALHLQYALPFANVVVILLGIPFALGSLKKGNVQAIFYAFAATFFYWGTASVFQSLGEQGHVLAWVSAWAPNIIFGILALGMLFRSYEAF